MPVAARHKSAMAIRLSKILDPKVWTRQLASYSDRRQAAHLCQEVDSLYHRLGPVPAGTGPRVVIAEGMWDNPNHFFRLRLFLEALPGIKNLRLIGVLRRKNDRTRHTLAALGFREFVFIEEEEFRTEDFLSQARTLLKGVHTPANLLTLSLPLGLPAYTYYDTVLKNARHPQPPLDDPLWLLNLAETLRNLSIYDQLLDRHEAAHVVLSHPWKNEFATLLWTALQRRIPAYHLTGYCEGIRVRRFCDPADFFTPVEHLSYSEYSALPLTVRDRLRKEGIVYLAQRQSGTSTDINARYAFRPDVRSSTRDQARQSLGGKPNRPLVIIYSHVWYDFPHTFAMRNFSDFLDWMRFTITQISKVDEVDWILKPHPTEQWYGGFRLADLLDKLPPHVRLVPDSTDSLTAMMAADAVVTVHGTIALEAVAHGLPVIAADRSYYSDWGFVHLANSREHYAELLASVALLPIPTTQQQADALACTALALAPTPQAVGVIDLRCDSSGTVLYEDILARHTNGVNSLNSEGATLRTWLQGNSSSYAANLKVLHFSEHPKQS